MKKLTSILMVCTIAVGAFASCGDNDSKEKKSKVPDISGKWEMDDMGSYDVDGGGLIFTEDGKGSMYVDVSSLLYMEEDGLNIGGMVLEKEYITYDGLNFSVNMNDMDMLTMKKTEQTDADVYDGQYDLVSGLLTDSLMESLTENLSKDKADIDLDLVLDGQTSTVILNNVLTYTIDSKNITLDGYAELVGEESTDNSFEYTLDGDTLTIKNDDETLELHKAE